MDKISSVAANHVEALRMSSHNGPAVTLADLIASGRLLWLRCNSCCHEVEVEPATLPLPPSTPVPAVRYRLRCSVCGGRDIDAKPQLHTEPLAAIRARASQQLT
jgi:hypothetical protein